MRHQLCTCTAAFEKGDCARGAYTRRAEKFCAFLVSERTYSKNFHKEMLHVSRELFVIEYWVHIFTGGFSKAVDERGRPSEIATEVTEHGRLMK
ncbi:hypothetical protein AVEN_209176-1 [Araneus ventricosus]|uniref:Uncharacterized protein n=1 Tax=Araneus ventricosus TaxID=182803 RepID=A0A4Y2TKW9_ARAVE|nr:hypothetical protein AVEN_209176-1 [Araneus ventricosus]